MSRPFRSTTRSPARARHGASGAVWAHENAASSSIVGVAGPAGGCGPGSTADPGATAGSVVSVLSVVSVVSVGSVVSVLSGASVVTVGSVLGGAESAESPSDDPHADTTSTSTTDDASNLRVMSQE